MCDSYLFSGSFYYASEIPVVIDPPTIWSWAHCSIHSTKPVYSNIVFGVSTVFSVFHCCWLTVYLSLVTSIWSGSGYVDHLTEYRCVICEVELLKDLTWIVHLVSLVKQQTHWFNSSGNASLQWFTAAPNDWPSWVNLPNARITLPPSTNSLLKGYY